MLGKPAHIGLFGGTHVVAIKLLQDCHILRPAAIGLKCGAVHGRRLHRLYSDRDTNPCAGMVKGPDFKYSQVPDPRLPRERTCCCSTCAEPAVRCTAASIRRSSPVFAHADLARLRVCPRPGNWPRTSAFQGIPSCWPTSNCRPKGMSSAAIAPQPALPMPYRPER